MAGGNYKKLTKFLKSLSIHPKIPIASDSYAYRATSTVWQTFDTEEQVNKRTEERVWFMHVLRRTVCECRLRKLLNCNRYASVEKTCRVIDDLHTCYTRAIRWL